MEIFSRLTLIILIIVLSHVQWNGVGGNLISKKTAPTATTPEPELPIRATICPNASTISPCVCWKHSLGVDIRCDGSAVEQVSVENTFREVRQVNGISEGRGVGIWKFSLYRTELTQLDLAPFYGSGFDNFHMDGNYNLTRWVTSGNPLDHGSIHATQIDLFNAVINSDEFGDALKYFSVEILQTFQAYNLFLNNNNNINNNNNNNNNNNDEFEFLPGLSAFVNLYTLEIAQCNISGRLNSSHFSAFPRLRGIYLHRNNIEEIGKNVFGPHVLYIYLNGNKLNESSFHPESGIAQPGLGKTLYVGSNQITTLPSEIFATFLDSHPDNRLDLENNPLFCDARLSWIKARRDEFELRVPYAICINDGGRSIWYSDLIP